MGDELTVRERAVLYYRWILHQNLETVGKIFKVSRERIRQVEFKAVHKLVNAELNLREGEVFDIGEISTDFLKELFEQFSEEEEH